MTDDELEAIYHRVTFVDGGSPIDFARAIAAAERESGVDFLFRWMKAKNPQLGGVSPLELLDAGRGHKLAQFIRNAESESGKLAGADVDAVMRRLADK